MINFDGDGDGDGTCNQAFKGPFIPSVSVNAAMTLSILFSLKTIQLLQNGFAPFSSDSIVFNENRIASVIAALTLMLGMHDMHVPLPFYEIRPVNARAVRILLKCILVL